MTLTKFLWPSFHCCISVFGVYNIPIPGFGQFSPFFSGRAFRIWYIKWEAYVKLCSFLHRFFGRFNSGFWRSTQGQSGADFMSFETFKYHVASAKWAMVSIQSHHTEAVIECCWDRCSAVMLSGFQVMWLLLKALYAQLFRCCSDLVLDFIA